MPRLSRTLSTPATAPLVRRAAVLVWILLAVLTAAGARAQTQIHLNPDKALTQYRLDHWDTDDGLPQNMITAAARTADGYLWFGTQEGVVRFDGLVFTVFDKETSGIGHNHVTSLAAAADGALWIGTLGGGVVRYADGAFTHFTKDDGLGSDRINALAFAPDGTLWIGTEGAGLARLSDGSFTHYGVDEGLPALIVSSLSVAPDGTVWAGLRGGLICSLPGPAGSLRFEAVPGFENDVVTAVAASADGAWAGTADGGLARVEDAAVAARYGEPEGLPSDKVLSLFLDRRDHLWIGTHGGVARITDRRTDVLDAARGLAHDAVKTLFADGAGSLWIGTDAGGLNRLADGKFDVYTTQEGLSDDNIAVVMEDRRGAVWIGTNGGGLNRLAEGVLTRFTTADGFPHDQVFGLAETSDGSVWIGTGGAGLVRHRDGRFTRQTAADGLPDETIYGLFTDRSDDLWISTGAGLVRYRDGRYDLFDESDGLSSTLIAVVAQDRGGDLWVGTYDKGLDRLRGGRVVAHYDVDGGLGSNTVVALYPDPEGPLWIGTSDGGLSRLHGDTLTTITTEQGLPNDKVFRILEDGARHLWMTSNKGVFKIAKDDLSAFARGERAAVDAVLYDRHDGLESAEFFGGVQPTGWKGRDGRLWLPSVGGLVSIDPQHIPLDLIPPRAVIEHIVAGEDRLSYAGDVLDIAPGPRKFEIHYAGLSFLAPEEVTYRYRLAGVDDEWVEAGGRRAAYYTNLAPGPYTFEVVARNADGVWSDVPAAVSFHLRPFFWQTVWFKALLVLLGALAVFGGFRLRVRQLEAHRRELEAQVVARTHDLSEAKDRIEAQADQLREMDRVKTRFFNNISHEFRTPLTLNIGPLENALTGLYGPVSAPMQQQLSIMLRNARRLLRLINQLLDISKLESGKLKLNRQTGDLAGFVEGVVLSFTVFAERKHLDLDFDSVPPALPASFDPDCMEKVFFNLLSNAVKFTPAGGRIAVHMDRDAGDDGVLRIRVSDTGQGIPAADLPHIFDRFHQVDGSVSDVQEGTGIGLSLVKELVELHGGTIEVESTPGEGTAFLLLLPIAAPADDAPALAAGDGAAGALRLPAPLAPSASPRPEAAGDDAPPSPADVSRGPMVEMAVFDDEEALAPPDDADDERPTILIVDDHRDIRDYIASCLAGRYRLRTACDGREGLEAVREAVPDLVVSDVMMPRMTGYELCGAIKEDPALRHLPVILLTAKASVDEKVVGLEAGADDYLTKPFNARELLARIENLLTLRRHQQQLQALNGDLSDANAALRDASELKSQFLRIAAHDLRTPLNSIQGFAEIAQDEIPPASEAHELLDLILSNARRMTGLISQVLEAEALESGEMTFDLVPLDLGAFVADVAAHHAADAARKDQELTVEALGHGPFVVHASEGWLREACDNLVSNAVKYSPTGRPIRVEVERVDDAVRFRVRDEGPGILEEDRPRLFKKFQKLTARPTGGEASTGLGLSIVKQIVEAHDGRVWVDSEPGEGSTFVIELPAALPAGDGAPDTAVSAVTRASA